MHVYIHVSSYSCLHTATSGGWQAVGGLLLPADDRLPSPSSQGLPPAATCRWLLAGGLAVRSHPAATTCHQQPCIPPPATSNIYLHPYVCTYAWKQCHKEIFRNLCLECLPVCLHMPSPTGTPTRRQRPTKTMKNMVETPAFPLGIGTALRVTTKSWWSSQG